MTEQTREQTDEDLIRTLVDARAQAVRAKDVARATSQVAPDVRSFDVVGPLQAIGANALRERAEDWFTSFDGPIDFEIRDLTIAADGDLAWSHSLNRISATTRGGKHLEMWWRSTVCYRKQGGEWRVAHEHNSVPFDPQTDKASLDLQP